MADWFIGSASKLLDGTRVSRWVHTIGFRSEHVLLALVVCDIDDISRIDRQSISMHINLHPIEAVDVVLVASGVHGALSWDTLDADAQHVVVHRLVDCIIDALTFGCPAVMRVTPNAIQWRKFDDHPIGTLTRHTAPIDPTIRHSLTQQCGDPVVVTTSSLPVSADSIVDALASAQEQPVTHVSWQHHAQHWHVTVGATTIVITDGKLPASPATTTWCLSTAPTRIVVVDTALAHALAGQP
ncbi:MAG: hypothetical protein ACKO83_13100 [Roseiflexaceae bacterium]